MQGEVRTEGRGCDLILQKRQQAACVNARDHPQARARGFRAALLLLGDRELDEVLADLTERAHHGEEELAVGGRDDQVDEEAQDVAPVAAQHSRSHPPSAQHPVQDHLLFARSSPAASPAWDRPVGVERGGSLEEEEEGVLRCRDDLAGGVSQTREDEVEGCLLKLQRCLAAFPPDPHADGSPVDRREEGKHAHSDPPVVVGEGMRPNLEEEEEDSERQEVQAREHPRHPQDLCHPLDRILPHALQSLPAHLFQPRDQPELNTMR
eukprot:766976-Hanusia_phi.AAC.11